MLRGACVEIDAGAVLVSGVLEFADEPSAPPVVHRYGPIVLFEAGLCTTDIAAALDSIAGGSAFDIPEVGRVSLKAQWEHGSYMGAGQPYGAVSTSWPSLIVSARFEDARAAQDVLSAQHGPLHGAGPLYPDLDTALRYVVLRGDDPYASHDQMRRFLVVLPDFRARINSVTQHDWGFECEVARGTAARLALLLDVYARTREGTRHARQRLSRGRAKVALGAPAELLLAHLITADGEIVDELDTRSRSGLTGLSGSGYDVDTRLRQAPRELRFEIEAAILGGEGPHTEFRESLNDKDDYRRLRVAVCALANSGGGLILVGVSDSGEVVGFAPQKLSDDQLARIVGDGSDPYPAVTIQHVQLNRPVTVIRVPPSADGLSMVNGVHYYRAGSTNRPMTHAELVQVVAARRAPYGGIAT
jgi:hypothetical protein